MIGFPGLVTSLVLLTTSEVSEEPPRPQPPIPAARDDGDTRAPSAHAPLAARELDVTLGTLTPVASGALRVETPKLRAVAPGVFTDETALVFTYLGPTEKIAPLASGAFRRQVGLKLRARDTCNVLYVMWRLAPVAELVVSVKENPASSRHVECGASGYRNVKPAMRGPLPGVEVGRRYELATQELKGLLRVLVDGVLVWEGRPFVPAASFDGPIGLRSDNGRFDLALHPGSRRSPKP